MKQFFSFLFIMTYYTVFAQSGFDGNYEGVLNGDKVTLSLLTSGTKNVTGKMLDSQNKFNVSGSYIQGTFTGKAIEPDMGVEFAMSGTLSGDIFRVNLGFDYLGEHHNMEVLFNKIISTDQSKKTKSPSAIPDKSRDQRITGTWVKESNYSSGYGSNNTYGFMSSSESMVFFSDGGMADGGSSTVIGGNDFSGKTSSKEKAIPGLYWWTENNVIYLRITEEGKSQEVALGKYYIENGSMLITGANGEKVLLTKQ
ncbi:MAG: hypothetical protein H7X99_07040 [Saprospiraceae bacterium]|nr:hypothetical protein [Saprospiraceae bacterium]